MRQTQKLAQLLLLCLSAFPRVFAQTAGTPDASASPNLIKDKYHLAQVDTFAVKSGLDFPPEYLKTLQAETSKQLADAKIFAEILPPGQAPANPDQPVLRLTGTIHNYKQGSRSKRYAAGQFGAGNAEVDAQLTLVDGATGQALVVEDLRAVLTGGVFGGDESKVTQELARQIAIQTKLILERKLPAPAEATPPAGAAVLIPATDHHTLTMDAKKWSEGEAKLGEDSSSGYRVASLSLTGSFTADLDLEKSAAPPAVYQYRWIHLRLATHLEKEVNQAAADGFRASPHTLVALGPYLTVVMEKPPTISPPRYQYRVSETVRLSNAQKDIATRQREGYVLLDELEFASIHILLFEKPAEETKK
ncbi:MAG TPA: DUF4410 domain-containing protein [Terriglobales bacterium]|nr:DUF4410 domain-containing protein [Terriglobales bacterium]